MKPCNVCKGLFKRPCMICGCKAKKKKKPKMDEHRREGFRERTMMLDGFSRNSIVFGNHTTELPPMDLNIEAHRKLADEIWEKSQTVSVDTLAKKYNLTKRQVKKILATKLLQHHEQTPNHLFPEVPRIRVDPVVEEARIAEVRKNRDRRKLGTFAKMEEVEDEYETDNNGNERLA